MIRAGGKCSLCGNAVSEKFSPFCSERCATLDLGRWLSEGYKVPVDDDPDESPSLPHATDEEE